MKKIHIFVVCALIMAMLASCKAGVSGGGDSSGDPGGALIGKTETASTKTYKDYKAAYRDVMAGVQEKQKEFSPAQDPGRACLYDIDGDGQDELICVYVGGAETLYCAAWTFQDGKPVLLLDDELASMADVGTGGVNLVEYEGARYICAWASNSEPWEPGEVNMYYNCFLWEYPAASAEFEPPFKYPSHIFAFRYYLTENNDIRSDAFSFLQDDRIALSIETFKELKGIFLDAPVQALCEADTIHGRGLTFDEMLSSLKA